VAWFLLERILEKDADLPVILITGHGDISLAVEAVKKGAYNFLQKPADEDIILATLSRAIERRLLVLENRRLEQQLTLPVKAAPAFMAWSAAILPCLASMPLSRPLPMSPIRC